MQQRECCWPASRPEQAVGATLELEGSSLDEATAGPQERRRQEREGTLRIDAGGAVAAAAWTTTAAEGGTMREGVGGRVVVGSVGGGDSAMGETR